MRTINKTLAGVAMAAGLATAASAETTLRIQTHQGQSSSYGQAIQDFVDAVSVMSGGELNIEMFYSSSVVPSLRRSRLRRCWRGERGFYELGSSRVRSGDRRCVLYGTRIVPARVQSIGGRTVIHSQYHTTHGWQLHNDCYEIIWNIYFYTCVNLLG